MDKNKIPSTHVALTEFLSTAAMSKGTFFINYRNDLAYTDLLEVRTDRMNRNWLARMAAGQGYPTAAIKTHVQ